MSTLTYAKVPPIRSVTKFQQLNSILGSNYSVFLAKNCLMHNHFLMMLILCQRWHCMNPVDISLTSVDPLPPYLVNVNCECLRIAIFLSIGHLIKALLFLYGFSKYYLKFHFCSGKSGILIWNFIRDLKNQLRKNALLGRWTENPGISFLFFFQRLVFNFYEKCFVSSLHIFSILYIRDF